MRPLTLLALLLIGCSTSVNGSDSAGTQAAQSAQCGGDRQQPCQLADGTISCNTPYTYSSHDEMCVLECGKSDEPACPTTAGRDACDSGLYDFNGVCSPCGQKDTVACIVDGMPVCAPGAMYSDKEGHCVAECGGDHETACGVTDNTPYSCLPGNRLNESACFACGEAQMWVCLDGDGNAYCADGFVVDGDGTTCVLANDGF